MAEVNSKRSIAWRTVGITVAGCLISSVVAWVGELWLTTVFLGTALSFVAALCWPSKQKQLQSEPSLLETPFYLAHDAEIFDRYRKLAHELLRVSGRGEPIYRKCALEAIDRTLNQVASVGDGKIVFDQTETWRLVYEALLRDPSVTAYRSVALVRDPSYWQDGAGSQSMRLNFDLSSQSVVTVERTVILNDNLWPEGADLPIESLRQWIHEQSVHGIWVRLVRESVLKQEPELIRDMGIYGFTAVGYQEFNSDDVRTSKFTLDFELAAIRDAQARWKRLNVYASSYKDILDQFRLTE